MTLDPAGSPVFGPGGGKYPVGQELQIFTMQNGASVHVTFDERSFECNGYVQKSTYLTRSGSTVRARCLPRIIETVPL